METVAETKESVTGFRGLMKAMIEELTVTYEDVLCVPNTRDHAGAE